jgi:transposase
MIGLPSLRALDGAQQTRIWLAIEATDMRCSFDRLAERVKAVIGEDPLSGHYFLFRSRRGDRNCGRASWRWFWMGSMYRS